MDVFLESDTDEEDGLIDENVTEKEKRFIQNLNNLDHADELFFETHSNGCESQTERGLKCVNVTSKNLLDLESISPPANSEEAQRGHMVRLIGGSFDARHICLDCGKHYSNGTSLVTHRRLHLGVNLHTCQFCQKQFAVKAEYEDHIRTHTGERPFKCPRCIKSFGSKKNLGSHKKRCKNKPT